MNELNARLIEYAYKGYLVEIQSVLDNGADINYDTNPARFDTNCTLMIAIREDRYEIAKLLFENGADLELKNNTIILNTIKDKHNKYVKLLIDSGVKFQDKSWYLYTSYLNLNLETFKYVVNKNLLNLVTEKKVDYIEKTYIIDGREDKLKYLKSLLRVKKLKKIHNGM